MGAEYFVGRRGEYAESPYHMPWRAWRQIALRVKDRIIADNISIVSAGVAFYGFLALFPALAALVMIYGLVADPATVHKQLGDYAWLMPESAFALITARLEEISRANQAGLSFGVLFSFAFALWSATKGIKALLTAMNIAYREVDSRHIVWQSVLAMVFTAGGIVFVTLALALIAAIPAAIELLEPSRSVARVLLWSRWLVLAILVMVALAVLYRVAPHRDAAQLRWITPGAMLAGALWLIVSGGFSFYVQNFGTYGETFGTLSAVVVLLMWFYLSAFVVCIGAELNAELEHQTYRDSTVGPSHRAGLRGAYVADHTWTESC